MEIKRDTSFYNNCTPDEFHTFQLACVGCLGCQRSINNSSRKSSENFEACQLQRSEALVIDNERFSTSLHPSWCLFWNWSIMPKYYCDYCDIFLTHDSPSVRKSHNDGWKHKAAVKAYYSQFEQDFTQTLIDQKIREFEGRMGMYLYRSCSFLLNRSTSNRCANVIRFVLGGPGMPGGFGGFPPPPPFGRGRFLFLFRIAE